MFNFEFDTGVQITDEELDETREAIKCTADEIDTEFLTFTIEHEDAEHMRDGPFVFQVHGASCTANLDKEEFRVDLNKAAFIPQNITLQVNNTQGCDDYSYYEITGTVELGFYGASKTVNEKDGGLTGFYHVTDTNLEVRIK